MEPARSSAAVAAPPLHVAIIMDGNGRWALARGLPRTAGHRQGAEAVKRTVRGAGELGIKYLTLFGFSSENWKRPEAEVTDLMGLMRHYLRTEIKELERNGARLRVLGEREGLARDIVELIDEAERRTAGNTRIFVNIAINYGARAEIVAAARRLAQAAREGRLDPGTIDETSLSRALMTADMPDPDLLIRTSGEQRLSNFMLW
ncbi:MAG: isoprenyl transferase, partial [Alphaproteobacteria bacterium]|nr:isoprenyl transferase [Alphaproteobacteria bacterium]